MSTIQIVRYGMGTIAILSNSSYAGMRAQNKKDNGELRTVAFICGLPYTLITYMVVDEGSERAYGVDIPKKQQPNLIDK